MLEVDQINLSVFSILIWPLTFRWPRLSFLRGPIQVDRLDEINTPGIGDRNFQYDEVSNINQIKSESGQFDYAYDQNSLLIGAYYKGGEGIKDEKFVWDASGNRLNGSRDPADSAIRPRPLLVNNGLFEDAEPTAINGVGRFSFIFDMHGNVVKKFDNQENIYYVFEYDADNKLVYAEKYNNDSLELKAKYTFDGLGRRIEKEITKGGTITRKSYVYNGENILLEYNTSGATPIEAAKYIGTGAIDDNLMTIRNGKAFFYHKDHLGSISTITNDAGEVVQKNQYSSFGKIVSIKDKDRKSLSITSALDQPFYYTGREWDEEIELYYYRARSFDPQTGRFISKDPIGLSAGDTNLYRYVVNSPISTSDPMGLFAIGIEAQALGFLGIQGGSSSATAVVSIDFNPFGGNFLHTEAGILKTGSRKYGLGLAATAGANAFLAIGNNNISDLTGVSVGASVGVGPYGGSVSFSNSSASLSLGLKGLPTQLFGSFDINATNRFETNTSSGCGK